MEEKQEGTINIMAREIYDLLEKKYANKDVGIRDLRRALRRVIDRLDLYEILQEMTEAHEILIHPFEKGYKKRIFPKEHHNRMSRLEETCCGTL